MEEENILAPDPLRNLDGDRWYLCIDLKSFYASVECVERGLDPLSTNLVVADPERSEKTICLAVSPSMKALGVRNRCRVFEIPPNIPYIMAVPRMQLYIDYAANIYEIFLHFFSKEDIQVYSIDEAFMDVTEYLTLYDCTPRQLGQRVMDEVTKQVGVAATCGIGTNLYLSKIALDITAKHAPDRIGELTLESYRRLLWNHRPLTDFWRIGPGTMNRLSKYGIYTMGQIAHADEDFLYRLFGIDAELLIDHSWGIEPTTLSDIKHYKPSGHSLSSGQVLPCDYTTEDARLVVKEMAEQLSLDLVAQGLLTESATLMLGYSNAMGIPMSNGTNKASFPTSSSKLLMSLVTDLFDKIARPGIPIRRINLSYNRVSDEAYQQYDLFTSPEELERERKLQKASISIKNKYGKNAILRGMDLQENATTALRNAQIGGHKK